MGKVKNKRRRIKKELNKFNPTGIVEVEEDDIPNEQTPDILKELGSLNQAIRQQACIDIANMILSGKPEIQKQLLDCGAITLLVQRLCDPYKPVRTSAAGALRNLTSEGRPEICEKLVEKDIFTCLLSAVQQV